MATISLNIQVANPGDVKVEIFSYGGPDFEQTFIANMNRPLVESFEVEDGYYAATISWDNGYHNIADGLSYNDNSPYYQVLGEPAEQQSVMATIPLS